MDAIATGVRLRAPTVHIWDARQAQHTLRALQKECMEAHATHTARFCYNVEQRAASTAEEWRIHGGRGGPRGTSAFCGSQRGHDEAQQENGAAGRLEDDKHGSVVGMSEIGS